MAASTPGLLLITRNLPPLRGGMERLNAQMANALAEDHHVTVMAPKGSRLDHTSLVRLVCCPWPGVAMFLVWAAIVGTFRALTGKPRWILGGSGLVAPVVLLAGWLSGARRAVYLHGLDIVVDSRLYRALWLPAIRRMNRCLVNSRNTRKLAIMEGVDEKRICIVFPGVAMPAPSDSRVSSSSRFRASHELGDGPLILSVGRLTRRKGLAEFVEHAMPSLLAKRADIRLVVIGDEAPDALNASGVGQRQRIMDAALRAGVDESVHMLGPVSESTLRAAFEAASVHVFPGLDVSGDVEGFGMVAIEAAAHGVPTVAFAVGGIPDAVNDPRSGSLVMAGDYAGLVQRLLQRVEDKSSVAASCREFAARFDWRIFDEALRSQFVPGSPE
ncbi:glycosyltransferase family 4 protein [Luteibacter aegosomatis]|uniref:glycosyltransferase family 4 protein n=1 Tax=Luteibacter aegosomatis TaxID=2911537 RepID=UPI001FF988D5|nr:glycosyltransferase family 4 protein [Luteibacter aegosomatis]UPG84814.1 glycosyltransferase family 4 protein [Luteibacter aegosomatis]